MKKSLVIGCFISCLCLLCFSIYGKKQNNQPSDSNFIRVNINQYLDQVVKTCKMRNKFFDEKVAYLETIFQQLRDSTQDYLKHPHIKTKDVIYLSQIRNSILQENLSLGRKLDGKWLREMKFDLRSVFTMNYVVYHNPSYVMSENPTLDDFSHEWAKKIYRGLQCLYPIPVSKI